MYETVKSLLTNDFDVSEDQIAPESTLEDLGLDSLASVEFALALEKGLGVEITDDEVVELERLDKILELVERRKRAS
ncbi:phosphopantetheine-binding protein [Streptomyces aurantiacus]|uniref:Putative Acyl carrier protein n=1 Tax=Streptomyces aurantiacus JA 4570 TaxID=1286094 RepID=S4ASK7_9ACTN|nr:phosphopantetheine-binding protein [Streptomyces aurantiacus]EPH44397.1 putative Acyl carrier protein [Streptomyces aurantiacus JA 4570]